MEHLLTLKSGLNELTSDECLTLMSQFNREGITTMLFQYFYFRLNQASSVLDINKNVISKIHELNASITTLVASRTSNSIEHKSFEKDDIIQPNTNQFDALPSLTIAAISSFLAFGDVIRLEKCSKSVFIASRSAMSMYALPELYSNQLITFFVDNSIKNVCFYWDRFKNIKQFTLNMSDFIQYDENEVWLENLFQCEYEHKLHCIPFWSNLQSLTIKSNDSDLESYYGLDPNNDNCPIRQFIDDLCNLSFDNLKTIIIEVYMDEADIDRILLNAPSLEYASAEGFDQITALSDKMKGFVISGDNHQIPVSKSIESLHLPRYDGVADLNADMPNLREICLHSPEQRELDWMNKHTLNCLERVNVKLWENFHLDEKLQKSLCELFGAESVNYISISADFFLNEMIDIICDAVEKKPKKSIKIRLFDDGDDQYSMSEMIQVLERLPHRILKLLNVLRKNAENYMVFGKVDVFKCESISDDIAAMKEAFLVQSELEDRDTHSSWSFVVSNKGCNINGYREKWLIDCEFCEYRQIFKNQ